MVAGKHLGIVSSVAAVISALLAPWTLHRRVRDLSTGAACAVAIVAILISAGLSTTLSTWTYLAGKGLLLPGNNQMDLGQDDLPPDSMAQVVAGFAGSLAVWILLLIVALLVCVAVADTLYRRDRSSFGIAVRSALVASVWFVAWAAAVLAANSVREGELRHPAGAIRAYAQLNQKGYHGSSAVSPGRPEHEPLAGPGRLVPLALAFPLVWSVGLPLPRGAARQAPRWMLIGIAVTLSWVAWWAVWRILPWIKLTALAG